MNVILLILRPSTISGVLKPIFQKITSVESSNSQKKLPNCHVKYFSSTLFTNGTWFHRQTAEEKGGLKD